jgi:hypothetical protein
MSHVKAALAALPIIVLGSAATAADFGSGVSATGQVKLSYADSGSSDVWTLGVDTTLSFRGDGGVPLGFDLTIDGVQTDDGFRLDSYWGGLVVGIGPGELTVGAPRPAVEQIFDLPRFSSADVLWQFDHAFFGSSLVPAAASINKIAPGLGYAGVAGDLKYAVTWNRISEGSTDLDAFGAAGAYQISATRFYGGLEYNRLSGGGISNDNLSAQFGMIYAQDAWSLGVQLGQTDGVIITGDAARIFGSYDIGDAVTLTGNIFRIDTGSGSDTGYSVGAEYRFGGLGFVEAGFTDIDTTEILDLGVGLKF